MNILALRVFEKMFHQLEHLSSLISNRTEDETILKLMDRYIQSSVAHNFSEERLMSKLDNYKEIEPHILEHRLMVKEFLDLRNDLQESLIAGQLEFKRILRKWQDHLFKYDKQFVELLLNQDILDVESEEDDRE
jgi:hemerythrin